MTMRARDALDFEAIALVVGAELKDKAEISARRTLHAPSLEATFGPIEVLTDLDLMIVLESALHEGLRQTCGDVERSTGRACTYEIQRHEDRIETTLIVAGRRVALAPVELRDVCQFP